MAKKKVVLKPSKAEVEAARKERKDAEKVYVAAIKKHKDLIKQNR